MGPVVTQTLRTEHKYPVIAKLVVFDDCKRLKCLAKPDGIGNDAATKAFKLVNGSNDAMPLKLVQFLPDCGASNTRSGFDDSLLVESSSGY